MVVHPAGQIHGPAGVGDHFRTGWRRRQDHRADAVAVHLLHPHVDVLRPACDIREVIRVEALAFRQEVHYRGIDEHLVVLFQSDFVLHDLHDLPFPEMVGAGQLT